VVLAVDAVDVGAACGDINNQPKSRPEHRVARANRDGSRQESSGEHAMEYQKACSSRWTHVVCNVMIVQVHTALVVRLVLQLANPAGLAAVITRR
jgi:hypothetical protein